MCQFLILIIETVVTFSRLELIFGPRTLFRYFDETRKLWPPWTLSISALWEISTDPWAHCRINVILHPSSWTFSHPRTLYSFFLFKILKNQIEETETDFLLLQRTSYNYHIHTHVFGIEEERFLKISFSATKNFWIVKLFSFMNHKVQEREKRSLQENKKMTDEKREKSIPKIGIWNEIHGEALLNRKSNGDTDVGRGDDAISDSCRASMFNEIPYFLALFWNGVSAKTDVNGFCTDPCLYSQQLMQKPHLPEIFSTGYWRGRYDATFHISQAFRNNSLQHTQTATWLKIYQHSFDVSWPRRWVYQCVNDYVIEDGNVFKPIFPHGRISITKRLMSCLFWMYWIDAIDLERFCKEFENCWNPRSFVTRCCLAVLSICRIWSEKTATKRTFTTPWWIVPLFSATDRFKTIPIIRNMRVSHDTRCPCSSWIRRGVSLSCSLSLQRRSIQCSILCITGCNIRFEKLRTKLWRYHEGRCTIIISCCLTFVFQ